MTPLTALIQIATPQFQWRHCGTASTQNLCVRHPSAIWIAHHRMRLWHIASRLRILPNAWSIRVARRFFWWVHSLLCLQFINNLVAKLSHLSIHNSESEQHQSSSSRTSTRQFRRLVRGWTTIVRPCPSFLPYFFQNLWSSPSPTWV